MSIDPRQNEPETGQTPPSAAGRPVGDDAATAPLPPTPPSSSESASQEPPTPPPSETASDEPPTAPRPEEPAYATGPDEQPIAKPGVRTGTIVWGVLVLAFCAIVLQRAVVAPGVFDPVGWITALVIGVGALLLVVAVAVLLRSRRR